LRNRLRSLPACRLPSVVCAVAVPSFLYYYAMAGWAGGAAHHGIGYARLWCASWLAASGNDIDIRCESDGWRLLTTRLKIT